MCLIAPRGSLEPGVDHTSDGVGASSAATLGTVVAPGDTRDRECPNAASCEMYAIFHHSGTLGAWKALYCTAQYTNCARYDKVRLGQPVPPNLMPNGKLLNLTPKA